MAKSATPSKPATSAKAFTTLLKTLRQDFPAVQFVAGDAYCWSPGTNQIFYNRSKQHITDCWSLLHEVAHANLQHARYSLDFELVELEVEAWEKAREIAATYGIRIAEDHIQDCLDTYRDWIYGRSVCPRCSTKTLQHDSKAQYRCFNCQATWTVSPRRFCRPYRLSQSI